jgi:two-component system OmpR family sensor kinase
LPSTSLARISWYLAISSASRAMFSAALIYFSQWSRIFLSARALALNKNLTLNFESSDEGAFRGDEDLLRRMVINLLDNAIKYTPDGGSVSVKLWREGGRINLRVTDNGIGIPAEAAARVFERFYRVDKARSRAEGGSGLGLPIVKWIAEAHHGSVSLESAPEHGSSFTVSLPA